MNDLLTHTLSIFFGFFAIMNPVANAAVFLGLTGDADAITRKQIARKSVLTAFLIVFCFCLLGKGIFELFGITLPALRITGGVLVFLVGFQMLHGEASKLHQPKETPDSNDTGTEMSVAISPLAIPILAGPGTIATAMNYSASKDLLEVIITVGAFTVLCFITYLSFVFSQRIIKLFGQSGLDITTRLMGLILAVIGAQMLIQGIHDAKELF